MSKEINPKLVFERLFGSADDRESAKNRAKRDFYRKSILDAVSDDAAKLSNKLGQTDRRKLDEYFTSIREIEQRIARSQVDTAKQKIPEMQLPHGVPRELDEHIRLMFDLMAIAFETDTTRVATFMLANEGSNRSYPMVGVNDGHHHLSHHQNKEDWIASIKKIDKYLIGHFSKFLEKLKNTSEGEQATRSIISMIVYGSAISDGNRHNHNDLPILLAGRGNGTIGPNRHLVYPNDTPLKNLFLSMLDRMGAGVDQLRDSTGRLDSPLEAVRGEFWGGGVLGGWFLWLFCCVFCGFFGGWGGFDVMHHQFDDLRFIIVAWVLTNLCFEFKAVIRSRPRRSMRRDVTIAARR